METKRTTDEFILALFNKRSFEDNTEAYITGYRLSKAFDSVLTKAAEITVGDISGTALESFTNGYREALK